MSGRKQVMDMRSSKEGISKLESDEQQRNWKESHWLFKASDSLSNYDPTRSHLNFEVTRGGIVQPIDKSKSIGQKMAENLASRGIKNPNDNPRHRRKQRIAAQFIFGGNRERMHEIAYGNQVVNLEKGADNSGITRSEEIEKWAVDVYNFVAKKFGEDNIISFYVHLDEKNPHCHCTVVPVNEENRISYRDVFGHSIQEESENMTKLHDELEAEVNHKWGLDRGSNMAETKAKHRSTEEYKRDLVNTVEDLEKQTHRLEIKLKSLSTMIAHLEQRKEDVQNEIDLIAKQFGQEGQDNAELAKKMAKLRNELNDIDKKIDQRKQMLDETIAILQKANEKLIEMKRDHNRMNQILGDDATQKATVIQRNILATYQKMLSSSIEPLLPTLSFEQRQVIEESGFSDLNTNSQDILNCAMLLALNYIHEATTYAESHGGGGCSNSGWDRDKDDDDERWWRKCIAKSASMMKPTGKRHSNRR